MSGQTSILVTGDFVLDHHIYEGRRKHYGDGVSPGVVMIRQAGGAAMVHDVIRELQPRWTSHLAVAVPTTAKECLAVPQSQHAYAFWRPHPRNTPPERQFWRVSEAMGFGAMGDTACKSWPAAKDLPPDPGVVVLSEGGMGFRESTECWKHLPFARARWIVLKSASPVAVGALWDELADHRDRLIVVVSAHELRKSTARISTGLSWEATLQDLLRELAGGTLAPLARCRHLVVAFESEGAVWIEEPASRRRAHLVYDADSIEGEHAHQVPGGAFGFLSCLTAAILWQVTLDDRRPDVAAALEGGLSAMRDLRERGHGAATEPATGFPASRLAGVISDPTTRYSCSTFPAPHAGASMLKPSWSLLRESQRNASPAFDLARLVALRGPIALEDFPHLRIGKLIAVDRREIEALKTLTQIMRHYQKHDPGRKPLSIGIFGPPGAGKSFAVRELATDLVGEDSWLEFNLSQFDTPADLVGAFHQIRDRVLQGRLPIAFFDEFDSQHYRWLQYLLAPMQDGKFQEGQLTHTLGKCIFMFAGATSWTFETFGPPAPASADEDESDDFTAFRLAKGPDFKSRLDAYLDVVGPNRRQVFRPPAAVAAGQVGPGHSFDDDPDDVYFPIRRALMIRAELRCGPDEKLELDEGLLRALLQVESYTHGSRSLNKILQPFQAARPGPLHRSLLPPAGQLGMHTDANAFLDICGSVPASPWVPDAMSAPDVEVMAAAIHDTFRALGKKKGWLTLGDETAVDFPALSIFFQNSNRAAAKRIPGILALVNLELISGSATEDEELAVHQRLEHHLELLADAEHEGWMRWHLNQGWRWAPTRNKEKRLHHALRPFSQLSEIDKAKDRTTIRNYPAFARQAKKKIVFARSHDGRPSRP